jgi:hypothetical protein
MHPDQCPYPHQRLQVPRYLLGKIRINSSVCHKYRPCSFSSFSSLTELTKDADEELFSKGSEVLELLADDMAKDSRGMRILPISPILYTCLATN